MTADGTHALFFTFARRGEDAAIRNAVSQLRGDGATAVTAVATTVSAPVLSGLGLDQLIVYGEGRGALAVVRALRAGRPAMAAIVYQDGRYGGHLKLETLALLSGAKSVLRVAPDASSAIGRASLAATVLAKGVSACCCAAVGGAMCTVAFVCLTVRQMAAGGRSASRH